MNNRTLLLILYENKYLNISLVTNYVTNWKNRNITYLYSLLSGIISFFRNQRTKPLTGTFIKCCPPRFMAASPCLPSDWWWALVGEREEKSFSLCFAWWEGNFAAEDRINISKGKIEYIAMGNLSRTKIEIAMYVN